MISSRLLRPLLASAALLPRQHVRTMKIESIPMWVGTSNNYAYLVTDTATTDSVIIDPAHPAEVLPVLQARMKDEINLTAILNTHHHRDHAGGNEGVLAALSSSGGGGGGDGDKPPYPVIGGKDCALVTHTPADGSTMPLGGSRSVTITAVHTPCHTQDSICFYVVDTSTSPAQRAVFTGDTLFHGGCGKFFEGSAAEMQAAMEKLGTLPDDTAVYPGHEYTKGNVRFLVTVDGGNEAVERLRVFAEGNAETQGRFTIKDEKAHNAFMRTDTPEMREVTGKEVPSEVMGRLREMKNNM